MQPSVFEQTADLEELRLSFQARPDESTPYLLSGLISDQFIDRLRAKNLIFSLDSDGIGFAHALLKSVNEIDQGDTSLYLLLYALQGRRCGDKIRPSGAFDSISGALASGYLDKERFIQASKNILTDSDVQEILNHSELLRSFCSTSGSIGKSHRKNSNHDKRVELFLCEDQLEQEAELALAIVDNAELYCKTRAALFEKSILDPHSTIPDRLHAYHKLSKLLSASIEYVRSMPIEAAEVLFEGFYDEFSKEHLIEYITREDLFKVTKTGGLHRGQLCYAVRIAFSTEFSEQALELALSVYLRNSNSSLMQEQLYQAMLCNEVCPSLVREVSENCIGHKATNAFFDCYENWKKCALPDPLEPETRFAIKDRGNRKALDSAWIITDAMGLASEVPALERIRISKKVLNVLKLPREDLNRSYCVNGGTLPDRPIPLALSLIILESSKRFEPSVANFRHSAASALIKVAGIYCKKSFLSTNTQFSCFANSKADAIEDLVKSLLPAQGSHSAIQLPEWNGSWLIGFVSSYIKSMRHYAGRDELDAILSTRVDEPIDQSTRFQRLYKASPDLYLSLGVKLTAILCGHNGGGWNLWDWPNMASDLASQLRNDTDAQERFLNLVYNGEFAERCFGMSVLLHSEIAGWKDIHFEQNLSEWDKKTQSLACFLSDHYAKNPFSFLGCGRSDSINKLLELPGCCSLEAAIKLTYSFFYSDQKTGARVLLNLPLLDIKDPASDTHRSALLRLKHKYRKDQEMVAAINQKLGLERANQI